MTLARIFNLFFLGFIPFLLLPGCDKDKPTIIKGIVTDRKTGGALDEVVVQIDGDRPGEKGLTDYFTVYVQSNANGEYECTTDGRNISARFLKNNYLDHFGVSDIRDGEENIKDVSLIPRDGFLSLTIQNVTGQNDTIFVLVFSPVRMTEERTQAGYSTKKYPLILKKNEIYHEVFPLASPDEVKIKWKYTKTGISSQYTIPIVPNDTAFYTLTY
jgi:hypothetical protein